MAKIIKSLTKPEDLIVTDTTGDTTLLYLSERKGAPAPYQTLDELAKKNYRFFVTQKKEVIEAVKKDGFPVVFDNNIFTLFRL